MKNKNVIIFNTHYIKGHGKVKTKIEPDLIETIFVLLRRKIDPRGILHPHFISNQIILNNNFKQPYD